jgi:hypothetical protein
MIIMEKLINYTINFLKVKAKIKIEKFVFFKFERKVKKLYKNLIILFYFNI